jgi:hypothetical protein
MPPRPEWSEHLLDERLPASALPRATREHLMSERGEKTLLPGGLELHLHRSHTGTTERWVRPIGAKWFECVEVTKG